MPKVPQNLFAKLANDFLTQNSHYGKMPIRLTDLVKAYSVFRETDYHAHSDNEEGHNYHRDEKMRETMGSSDWRKDHHYLVWTVIAESFDDYLKRLLRGEVA